jgi:hypothetical protein
VKKNGRRRGVQRYQCRDCGHLFQSKRRGISEPENLWQAYTFKRQTVTNLCEQIGLSERQVRRKLKMVEKPSLPSLQKKDPVVLVMDTTYFDLYGVMVFRCWTRKRNLLWYFVQEESNIEYLQGIHELETKYGYKIAAVVCDGKKWLCGQVLREGYPVQHCQFHMLKTVTRYLTRHPVLSASIELRRIAMTLKYSRRESFTSALQAWHEAWKDFLKERTTDPYTGHWQYTHRRIRGAYASLLSAIPYLFTFQDHETINIPKTTNTLDGTFSHLKQKIYVHRGLNLETQKKMVETLLTAPTMRKGATRNVH